jgi:hypothetical protein
MKQISLFILASALPSSLATVGGSHSTVRVCNRGFCYNKKEDWRRSTPSLHHKKRNGLDFCTDTECEVFSILGTDIIEEEEVVECVNCPPQQTEQPNDTRPELDVEFEVLEDLDLDKRRSWKEEPKKGSCYDNDLGYLFDCNLIKILE